MAFYWLPGSSQVSLFLLIMFLPEVDNEAVSSLPPTLPAAAVAAAPLNQPWLQFFASLIGPSNTWASSLFYLVQRIKLWITDCIYVICSICDPSLGFASPGLAMSFYLTSAILGS